MHKNSESTSLVTLFHLGDGPSSTGARLGGRAPEAVHPNGGRSLKYFLTVPLEGGVDRELSVFIDPDFALTNGGEVVSGGGVEVVFHESSRRSTLETEFDSTVSAHPILLDEQVQDEQDEEGELVPSSANKLGGQAYLVARGGQLELQVRELESEGFAQCLQIDFPGARDATVSGDWPIGTGIFHVLIRCGDEGLDWRCFWEA